MKEDSLPLVADRIMPSPKDILSQLSEPVNMAKRTLPYLHGNKDFADVIMLRISRRESIVDNPGGPNVIISVLIKQKEEGQS